MLYYYICCAAWKSIQVIFTPVSRNLRKPDIKSPPEVSALNEGQLYILYTVDYLSYYIVITYTGKRQYNECRCNKPFRTTNGFCTPDTIESRRICALTHLCCNEQFLYFSSVRFVEFCRYTLLSIYYITVLLVIFLFTAWSVPGRWLW